MLCSLTTCNYIKGLRIEIAMSLTTTRRALKAARKMKVGKQFKLCKGLLGPMFGALRMCWRSHSYSIEVVQKCRLPLGRCVVEAKHSVMPRNMYCQHEYQAAIWKVITTNDPIGNVNCHASMFMYHSMCVCAYIYYTWCGFCCCRNREIRKLRNKEIY